MLTVIGDPLTIRANDVTITQGSPLPVFTSSFTGLKIAGDAGVLSPVINYTITDSQNNVVTGPVLPKGLYVIRPNINSQTIGTNYLKKYEYGILYVK